MGEKIKCIIVALVHSENAMSLIEFIQATNLTVEEVAYGLDLLVAMNIFNVDNSFHNYEMGEMIYMFADNPNAQTLFNSFLEDGKHDNRI